MFRKGFCVVPHNRTAARRKSKGCSLRKEKDMEIRSVEQLDERLSTLIGKQNTEATMRALADGARIWVFTSVEAVRADQELDEVERKFCLDQFAAGEKWAGIFRPPKRSPRPPIPGFTTAPGYDSHGNSRGGGSNWPVGCDHC